MGRTRSTRSSGFRARVPRVSAVATSGTAGAVVSRSRRTSLVGEADVRDAQALYAAQAHPGADDLARAHALLQPRRSARHRRGRLGVPSRRRLLGSARRTGCRWRVVPLQDYVDKRVARLRGHLTLAAIRGLRGARREADLLLVVGARLARSRHSAIRSSRHPAPSNPHHVTRAPRARRGLRHGACDRQRARGVRDPDLHARATRLHGLAGASRPQAHADYVDSLRHTAQPGASTWATSCAPPRAPGPRHDRDGTAPANFSVWAHRFWEFRGFRSSRADEWRDGLRVPPLSRRSSSSRSVSSSVPVTAIPDGEPGAGDAVQYDTPCRPRPPSTTACTGRSHASGTPLSGPGDGTALRNPDFAALAEAYGAFGERVERTADFRARSSVPSPRADPRLHDLVVDPEAITPGRRSPRSASRRRPRGAG